LPAPIAAGSSVPLFALSFLSIRRIQYESVPERPPRPGQVGQQIRAGLSGHRHDAVPGADGPVSPHPARQSTPTLRPSARGCRTPERHHPQTRKRGRLM
jgi:hypothetical protein